MCHGGAGVGGGVVDFESVAGGEYGGLGDNAILTYLVRSGVPVGFGNGELFADFHRCVVNAKTHTVYLQSLGSGFQTFLERV